MPEESTESAGTPPVTVSRVIDPSTRIATFNISFLPENPPDVVFDTNVWVSMRPADLDSLKRLRLERGFRYRYSVTNYVELLSRLARGPAPGWMNPFGIVRGAFRRIHELCDAEVLPSPEMEYLEEVGLSHYLEPEWAPNPRQTALAVEAIRHAETLGDITGQGIQSSRSLVTPRWLVDPAHYLRLTETDERSMRQIIGTLDQFVTRPFRRENVDQLTPWFVRLASFFLLVRPSGNRARPDLLSQEERSRFVGGFTYGAGRMFNAHITLVAYKELRQGAAIDPNDLYDALQLLLLRDDNRLFVTNERSFFRYYQNAPAVQRVVPWEAFGRG